MSVNALKPTFTDREGYLAWRRSWKLVYLELSKRIRAQKIEAREAQRKFCLECQGEGWFGGEGILPAVGSPEGHVYACPACEGQSATRWDRADAQSERQAMRRDATKMMTLLDEAKLRRDRILAMHKQIADQPFPLEMEANRIDFYFNKGSIEFPMLPPWVVKAKGRTFYVRDFVSDIGFSTKNKSDGPTRGLLRFRAGKLTIDDQAVARLT